MAMLLHGRGVHKDKCKDRDGGKDKICHLILCNCRLDWTPAILLLIISSSLSASSSSSSSSTWLSSSFPPSSSSSSLHATVCVLLAFVRPKNDSWHLSANLGSYIPIVILDQVITILSNFSMLRGVAILDCESHSQIRTETIQNKVF